MQRKYFPRDKNYVLESAQLSLENTLLLYLVDYVKVEYLIRHNPLNIDDDTSRKITHHKSDQDFNQLQEFYLNLAGVYRFMFYSDNQLAFSFDGRDEFQKYQEEWENTLRKWVKEFCKHENFLRAVLELTVFYPQDYTPQMAGLRMSAFITKFFEVKLDPQKGFVRIKAA